MTTEPPTPLLVEPSAQPEPNMDLANRIAIIAQGLSYNDGQREAQAKHLLFEIVSALGGTGLAASPQPTAPLSDAQRYLIGLDSLLRQWETTGSTVEAEFAATVRGLERGAAPDAPLEQPK